MPPRLPRCRLFALHLLLVIGFTLQPLLAAAALAAPVPAIPPASAAQEAPLAADEAPVVWPILSAEQPMNLDTPPAAVPLDGLFPPEELADPGPAPDPLVIPALPDVPLDLHIEADRYLVAPGETVVVTLSLFAAPEQTPVQATVHFTLPTSLQIVGGNAPVFPWSVETAALGAGATYSLTVTPAADPSAPPAVVELRLGATAPGHQARQVRHLLGLLPSPTPLPPDTETPDTGPVDSAPLQVELGVQGTVLATADLAVLAPPQPSATGADVMAAGLPYIRYTPGYDALRQTPDPSASETISEVISDTAPSATTPSATPVLSHTLRLPFVALASAHPVPQPEPVAMAAPFDPPAAEGDVPTLEDNGVIFYRLWHLEAQGLPLAAAPALPESPDGETEEMPADLAHPRFATPVLLVVDVAALAAQGVDMDIVQLWTRPDATQDWQPVPGAAYDAARQVWIAWLTHFSDFGLGIAPSVSGELLPSLHGASSDLQTGAAHPLRVQLNYGPRTDTNVNDGCQARWTNLRLDSLSVEALRSGAWQVLRQYELTPWYPTKPSSSTHTDFIRHLHLQKIEEYGNTGTNGAALPAYTFMYLMRLDQPTGAHADTENNIRLSTISNGQGGKITYTYIEQEPECPFQDGLCSNEYRWLVSKTHVEDGLGSFYDTAYAYDQTHVTTYGERFLYLGASSATVTVYAPNGTTSVVRFEEHTFYRGHTQAPSALLGQRKRHVIRNAPGGTIYSDIRTLWAAWDRSGSSDSFFVINTLANGIPRWVRLERQDEWVQGQAKQQVYYYHTADQANQQFGNVTTVEERAPDAASVAWSDWDAWVSAGSLYPLRRSTQTQYMPNSSGPDAPESPYVVDRPARVLVKDSSGVCQAETRWVYADYADGSQNRGGAYTSLAQTPLVVKQEQVVSGCPRAANTSVYDANLLVTTYGYDAYGNRTMAVQHGANAAQDIRIDTTYDSAYHVFPISQRYAANAAIEERVGYYGVNSSNEDAADYFWGEAAAYCTPNDVCTYYAYDDYGRLTRRWEQMKEGTAWAQLTDQNASAQLTYYAPGVYAGQLTYIATEWRAPRCQGNFVRKHYDGLGRLVAEQRAYQNWSHAVDGCGAANQGQEIQVNYAYDALDQPVKTSVPRLVGRGYWSNPAIDWNTTPYSHTDYNPIGRVTRQVAPNGEQTDFAYLGRAASVITAAQYGAPARTVGWQQDDPLGQPHLVRTYAWNGSSWVSQSQVQLSYGVTGNLAQVVYPGSLGTSTFTYDQAGRRTAMNDIDLGSWSYAYNRLSHLVRQRDARNQVLCFYADAIGRPLARYDNGTAATCPATVPANTHVRYAYDGGHAPGVNASRGLLTQVMVREGSAAGTWSYTRDLSYSAQGLPQSETISYPNSVSFTTQTLYDAYLRPATLIYADGEQVTASYNGMGLVTKLTSTPSGGTAQTLIDSVSYNEAGLLTALRMRVSASEVLWRTQLYHPWNAASADSNARLMHIRVGTTNDPANDASHNKLWLGYQYESFGNPRVLFEGSHNGAVVANPASYDDQRRLSAAYGSTFGFDTTNRMSAFEGRSYSYGATHPQALSSSSKSGTATLDFTYDANGNLTQRQYLDGAGAEQTQTLVWDAANRLRSVTQGSTVETYWYDDSGQRVRKQRGSSFSYYPNRYHERGGSAVTKVYYLGEMPIALRAAGSSTVTYLHSDALGSVVLTTQGTSITGSRWYRAYGAKRSGNDFAFERNYTGQRLDDTGLLYYGARYYDPAAGRFIAPDTLVPDPSDPLDYNRYLYARGNPLKYTDPSGHWVESALDVAFIGYDLYDIRQNGLRWDNGLALAADIGGLLLPLATGGGLAVQAVVHGDDAAKMLRAASRADALDDAVRAGRLAQNAFDGVRVGDKVVDTSSLLVQHFEQAAAYGIGTYDQLKAATAGTGLTVHHVVEKRFARNLMEESTEQWTNGVEAIGIQE